MTLFPLLCLPRQEPRAVPRDHRHWDVTVKCFVAFLFLVVVCPFVASAQNLPDSAVLGGAPEHWRVYPWATERVAENRARCRDAIMQRLRHLISEPSHVEIYGARLAEWELYGDDFDIVGTVDFQNKHDAPARLSVWCQFTPDGALQDIRIRTRF